LGVTVHPMIRRRFGRELIAGIADDATFGPIVVFGHGGTGVEAIDDTALALPPLDLRLAEELIARTRIARLLDAYRHVPAADVRAIALVLVALAGIAAEFPEIRELDINPLLADDNGVLALDARIAIAPAPPVVRGPRHPRLAIRPYPRQWERELTFGDGKPIFARPVRAEDEPLFERFLARTSREDLRLRFFSALKHYSHAFIARLTQIDYARGMAFVAVDDAGELAGVVRLHSNADYERGEFAILVRSDLKGRGLGGQLMTLLLDYAHAEGLREVYGEVLAENRVMLNMCAELGFRSARVPGDPGIVEIRYALR
jgi:acetyltransferase